VSLDGIASGYGTTPQAAADDLVVRLLSIALAWRSGSFRFPAELGPIDPRLFEFIHELGEIAAAGGEIRERIFGGRNDAEAA
jgi:hypothetical protein